MDENKNIAIRVDRVSKTFKIPHEKIDTMRGAFVNILKKNTYEEFKALDEISFSIKKGEFFGIIGRNGSGKSTLLKILAGIYNPDTGNIKIRGLISPFLELGIGFNMELSGRDNIYLNGTVLGLSNEQIKEKFDDIVSFSELDKFIDQKLKNYSSGMQVRLAFSVAIHANRDILLMDEVLAVGDSNFQQKCLEEFNKYKDSGKTVVLVTHDTSTIQKYCDRALLLRKGKIEMMGNPEEVGNRYIYQNMSDEEKRIFDEEKRVKEKAEKELEKRRETKGSKDTKNTETQNSALEKKEKPRRKKIAEITKVELLDKDGGRKNVFETGELLNIKIDYEFREKIRDPIFGIIIRNDARNDVFALNTMYKKIDTGLIEEGFTKAIFSIKNYFSTGTYFVSPTVADRNQRNIDWKDNLKSFRIINKEFDSKAIADFVTNIIIK